MNNKLVSVVISAYNHENYIQETLSSIIKQTYKNIELIVIDDGSKDQTYERILEMESALRERFVRVHIEKQENIGCARTGNKLVKLSSGEYLYPIASDDVAHPDAIEKLIAFISKNLDFGLVSGNAFFIDSKSNLVSVDESLNIVSEESFHSFETINDYSRERLLRLFGKDLNKRYDLQALNHLEYRDFWFDNLVPNGYIIRKEVYKYIVPFSVNTPVEDLFFNSQLIKYYKIKILSEPLFFYRIHSSNTIKNTKYMNIGTRTTRLYELYLLDNKYPEFKTEDLKDSWWYCILSDEWEKSKISPYWDEQYYINKYPEVLEKGYVPLVHYLSIGKEKKYFPSKHFEKKWFLVKKGKNVLINSGYEILRKKIERRKKALMFSFLIFLSLIPGFNIFMKKNRGYFVKNFIKEINKKF